MEVACWSGKAYELTAYTENKFGIWYLASCGTFVHISSIKEEL
jgi:hypothetical protein